MPGLFAGTPLEQPVLCERCKTPIAACRCPRDRNTGRVLVEAAQQVRIRRESRRGKTITVITGLAGRSERTNDLPTLVKSLKSQLGAGGSLDCSNPDSPVIEIQGDHRDRLVEHFRSLGYPAKAAGG